MSPSSPRPLAWWRAVAALIGGGIIAYALSMTSEPWVTQPDQRAVVIATLPCTTALQATSSGFVADDRTVVTVAHAIYESRDVAVRDSFGRWHRPEIVRLDLDDDIAVLRVSGLRATPLERAEARPTSAWEDTPVVVLDGAASGRLDAALLRRVRVRTEVIGDRSQQATRSGYEVAADVAPGDSGAAILDRQGHVAAMLFARSTSRPSISWATAIDEIDATPGRLPPGRAIRLSRPTWCSANASHRDFRRETQTRSGSGDQ